MAGEDSVHTAGPEKQLEDKAWSGWLISPQEGM